MATSCTITCTTSTKKASLSTTIAFRESVSLTLSGITGSGAADLRLGLVAVVAGVKTLMALCETFTASGSDFAGTLSLNTSELEDYFEGYRPDAKRWMHLAVWDITDHATLVNDLVEIQNNPFETGMDDPTAVDPIAGLEYAAVANGVTNGDSHDHSGGDGAQIAHTALSSIGTLTHAQLEASLALKAVDATTTASLALKADKIPTNGSYRISGGQHLQFYNATTGKWHTLICHGSEGNVQTGWGPGET